MGSHAITITYICTCMYIYTIQVPSKLLIQVPRHGKKYQSFQKIIPDIQLDISEVTDSVHTGNNWSEFDLFGMVLKMRYSIIGGALNEYKK